MIYHFFCTILQPAIRAWFWRIYVTNEHNVPANSPIILACNHPSSGMDGILMALMMHRPLYFLSRSDIFNKPWKKWFLGAIHLLPIYRMQEGFENLTKNDDTFSECFDLFRRNGVIIIFPEGFNVNEKRLRPFKKGAAKLALQSYEAIGKELYVVPVGINYTDAPYPRNEVMVNFGEPIAMSQFYPTYQENKPKAITQLTRQLADQIAPEVIIQSHGTETLSEHCLTLARSEWRFKEHDISRLRKEQAICERINQLQKENQAEFTAASAQVVTYFNTLKQARITDLQLVNSQSPSAWLWWILKILGMPISWLGKAVNFLPLYFGKRLTKQKVKMIEFVATVRFVASSVFYMLYVIVLLPISFSFGWTYGVGVGLLLAVSGFVGMWLQEIPVTWMSLQADKKLYSMRKEVKGKLGELLH